jgi:two-component system, response regulator PdtaR
LRGLSPGSEFMSTSAVRTVVLVEDEPLVLQSTTDLLETGGYCVVTARSCEEALRQIEACPEAIALVTDISIEGDENGLDLAQQVSKRWPHMRTVIVSGRERPRGHQYPQDAVFFTKPYAPGALLTIIDQFQAGQVEPRTAVPA